MTSTPPTRTAVIGCGTVAELYYVPTLDALEREGRISVVALIDPDRPRRDMIGRAFPAATRCDSLALALSTRPQLVILASPPRWHAAQAIEALTAGIDVFCEKPLATSTAEARRMADAARNLGRLLAVGMVRRHLPAARMIRTMIAQDTLGALRGFEVFEGGPFRWPVHGPEYFDRRVSGGGVLLDIGAHVLDLLIWWLGDPTEVIAEDDAMGGIEANCRLTLRCGGIRGSVRLSRDWQRPNHITIHGARGSLRWDLEDTDRIVVTLDDGEPVDLRPASGTRATFLDCFRDQLSAVLDATAGEPAPVAHAVELLPSIQVVETAYSERSLMAMPWLSPSERSAALRARSS